MSINEDAGESQERAEQGRRANEFRDFLLSVRLDIKDTADAGGNKTAYPISDNNREFVDDAISILKDQDYDATFDESGKPKLVISWEPKED